MNKPVFLGLYILKVNKIVMHEFGMITSQKVTKKCVIKRKLKIQDHKHCLEATNLENKINQNNRK